MNTFTILKESIQKAGLRLTPQRLAICHLLADSKEHPTARDIYDQLRVEYPSISLATVYNTVEALVKLGVVNELGSAGDSAIHFDANTTPHINVACISCHQVIDLESAYVTAIDQEVAVQSGYQIKGARVLYYGLCPECQLKIADKD